MNGNHAIRITGGAALLGALALSPCLLTLSACGDEQVLPTAPAKYVGGAACVSCHEREHRLWKNSHHDLAMQPATDETVLGNFDGVTFEHHGVESKFYRTGEEFFVRTDGPDGILREYQVMYTFGAWPLQQYLIEFPRGRLQALSICWDTRPKEDGGQRWFHLYPDEQSDHNDELHWTGLRHNWNYSCAECHSTNLQKNYDQKSDTYRTTWSDIDVSCEACHGPGSEHVKWAKQEPPPKGPSQGLVMTFGSIGAWSFEPDAAIAVRDAPLASHIQVETCARCHSRRTSVHGKWTPGQPSLDVHLPALLTDRLYHADGQIEDEVFVYGSFLQSKMYHKGVTCNDCHDSHSLNVVVPGNALCVRCHKSTTYDVKSHHFHEPGTRGASCIKCHMPLKHYMVVDPRRDHSLRIPRPDLSVRLGTPNACNRCHGHRSAEWSVEWMAKWYPDSKPGPHYGEALYQARRSAVGAADALRGVAADRELPAIARATALSELAELEGSPTPEVVATLSAGLRDESPLVRLGALMGLQSVRDIRQRAAMALPLVADPMRVVRIEAARALAPMAGNILGAERQAVDKAVQEYIDAQLFNADQPFGHFNLGLFYSDLGRHEEAEAAYRVALDRNPRSVRAHANLADLYRVHQRDDEAEKVLWQGVSRVPDSAELHHAFGLLLIRQQRRETAMQHLQKAAELRPENPRFSYVFAVALESAGQVDRALSVLERTHKRHPTARSVLRLLVTYYHNKGALDSAIHHAERLVQVAPRDASARKLLEQLQQERRR
ncbi:MAG: tetratricopeptide repeat protein [Planctomycetota bacterium]